MIGYSDEVADGPLGVRFTADVRRLLRSAQDHTRRLGHGAVDTVHLLLALTEESDRAVGSVLASEGVTLDELRGAALARTGSGAFPTQTSIPYSPQATLVFELAAGEADLLGHERIGPEHILLGVLSEGSGLGARVLSDVGAHLPRVRQRVAEHHLA